MKKRQWFMIAVAVFGALLVFGDMPPRTLPSKGPSWFNVRQAERLGGAESRAFHLQGKDYRAFLRHADISSSPEWNPSLDLPLLPLPLSNVEDIARRELRYLVADDSEWVVSSFQLNSFPHNAALRWYYAVTFNGVLDIQGLASDSVVILVTLDGKPGQVAVSNLKK
jgi:hypothetical protein